MLLTRPAIFGSTFSSRWAVRIKSFDRSLMLNPKIKSMNFYTLFNPVRKKRGRLFKLLLVVKLVILLITVACLHVSAATLAQTVTLKEKDAPLEKVFNDIKKQTGYIFFYENLRLFSKLNIDFNNIIFFVFRFCYFIISE